MLRERHKSRNISAVLFVCLCCLSIAANLPATPSDYERTYPARGAVHLNLYCLNGDIHLSTWDRATVNIRATTSRPSLIEDSTAGEEISIRVKRQFKPIRVDFDVMVPAQASVVIENVIGKIDVKGLKGHLRISSIDSNVRLIGVNSQSLDVKVTSGDIYFEGDLHETGSYGLQTMKGDIDVTLPVHTPFNLNARALTADINLGAFLSELTGGSKTSRGVSGTHLTGGPRLNLTTYAGKIFLHKK
jgi:hypothetical protein